MDREWLVAITDDLRRHYASLREAKKDAGRGEDTRNVSLAINDMESAIMRLELASEVRSPLSQRIIRSAQVLGE